MRSAIEDLVASNREVMEEADIDRGGCRSGNSCQNCRSTCTPIALDLTKIQESPTYHQFGGFGGCG